MEITTNRVKELRDRTGVSVMQCKKALEEAGGDMTKAERLLREKSVGLAEKKSDREQHAGAISSYVHATGTSGTIVELLCETDFVAKNEEFKTLARDIAMHTTAMAPESTEELLAQTFIKNPDMTIQNLVTAATQKFGENITISRFTRYAVSN